MHDTLTIFLRCLGHGARRVQNYRITSTCVNLNMGESTQLRPVKQVHIILARHAMNKHKP